MKPPRLRAQPIAEGVALDGDQEVIVWRDFRWNNGQVWRDWFVDPEKFAPEDIETKPIEKAARPRKRQ
jgi:alpha-glucuronidase